MSALLTPNTRAVASARPVVRIAVQVAPVLVEYSHCPWVASDALAVMAIPARLLPPVAWVSGSLKLPLNRLSTVAPVGAATLP